LRLEGDIVGWRLIGAPPANPIQQLIDRNLQPLAAASRRHGVRLLRDADRDGGSGVGCAVIPTFAIPACRRHRIAMHPLKDPVCRSNSAKSRVAAGSCPPGFRGLHQVPQELYRGMGGALVAQVRLNALRDCGAYFLLQDRFQQFAHLGGILRDLDPHSSITASFSCAVPLPPEMMAPAWPCAFRWCRHSRDKATTGFFMFAFTQYAAVSSSDPPISPTMITGRPVSGSSLNIFNYVDVFRPFTGSPPVPTQEDCPSPSSISCRRPRK